MLKTAYEMRISDWSSDVCSSDLSGSRYPPDSTCCVDIDGFALMVRYLSEHDSPDDPGGLIREVLQMGAEFPGPAEDVVLAWILRLGEGRDPGEAAKRLIRSEEHTSELQSLMRISYAVFCLKNKNNSI